MVSNCSHRSKQISGRLYLTDAIPKVEIDRVNSIINGFNSNKTVEKVKNDKTKTKFCKILNDDVSYSIDEVSVPNTHLKRKKCGCANLLIVDDQIINRMILREFGLNLGLISDEAENGKIAYKMYCDQIEKQC